MKQFFYIICAYMATTPLSTFAQDNSNSFFRYDEYGNVKSVFFSKTERESAGIKNEDVFFKDILKIRANNTFVRNKKNRLDKGYDTFDQYYKGIKIEGAGYTFHYDEDGHMMYAHGNYVDISDLDINPAISKEDAAKAFAKYKGLSPDSITHFSAELIIKRIKGLHPVEIPLLVYKVTIAVNNICVTEYGYVDAKTGDVECSESYIYNTVATGTFYTKYYGTKYATTNWDNGNYYLYDPSRGDGIEIKDLQNYCMDDPNYLLHETPIMDSDNYWHYNDYTDSTFMAFDIHWAFQKIYDRLYNVHGKNSIDNNGKKIMAYVNTVFANNGSPYTENACWDGDREEFYFGRGESWNRPLSTLDIVAHEYGHGITYNKIGWSGDQKYLNEGLSDIWAAIMDYRFGDANAEVWKIGEHMIPLKTCLRDMAYPENPNADSLMASTYNSTDYNYYRNNGNYYAMSGVFSHWFYLLVNGGQGYNSNGTYYNLSPIGMDVAENLIVKTVYEEWLKNKISYEDVRDAFVFAAISMSNSGLVNAVCDAWDAVGVKSALSHRDLSGPSLICASSPGTYSINNLQPSYTVNWTVNNSDFTIIPSGNQCIVTYTGLDDYDSVTLTASIYHSGYLFAQLTKTIKAGVPEFWADLIITGGDGIEDRWTSNLAGSRVDIEELFEIPILYTQFEANLYRIVGISNPYYTFVWHWNSFPMHAVISNYLSLTPGYYLLQVRGVNNCGTSDWVETEVECIDTYMPRANEDDTVLSFIYNRQGQILTVTINHASTIASSGSQSHSNALNNYTLQLWNETSMVREYKLKELMVQIPMTGLKNGLYTVRYVNNEKVIAKKFFKR